VFLSDIAIKRPVFTSVVLLVIVIFGAGSYLRTGVELFPEIDFPAIIVSTTYSGAGPEEVEKAVTKPIEDNITLVDNVKYVESASSEGASTVVISFFMGTDLDIAANDVRDQVGQIVRVLPDDADEPVVMKLNPNAFPVMRLAASGDLSLMDLHELADDTIRTELGKIEGVGLIRIVGGEQREIRVEVDQSRLEASGVSISHVISAVSSANLEIPGGRLTQEKREYAIRVLGEISSPEEVGRIPLPGTGGSVLVQDVARVLDTAAEVRTIARTGGYPSVGVEILKQGDANTIKVGEGVRAAVERLNADLMPPNTKLEVITDDSIFIRDVVDEVGENMFQGVLLTAIALYLFLHSMRGTVIIALGMPASVVATFILLYFAGYTINIMSMMGLAISIGILVNNAILVLENIHRHIDMGDDPKTAASRGTSEIAVAVASTTLTNIVVFLPIAFMESVVGQVFRQFAMTVVFATLFSLMTALTLTPMLASMLLKKKEDSDAGKASWLHVPFAWWDATYNSLSDSYVRLVERIVRHPWTVVAISAIVFFAIMGTIPRILGGEFFPQVDEGVFVVNVETDVASSLDYTDMATRKVEKICNELPEVSVVYSTVGSSSSSEMFGASSGANVAQVVVKLTDKEKRERSTVQVMNSLRPVLARLVGAKITLSAAEQGGPGGKPIELEVSGEDIDTLKVITGDALDLFRGGEVGGKVYPGVPGLVDADTEWREGKPEVSLQPDRNRLRLQGVTIQDLAESIRAYYTGVVASRYREGDDEYDIRVQLSDLGRKDASILDELSVPSVGGLVRVSELVNSRRTSGPTQLTRKNREHMIRVVAETSGRTAGEVHGDLVKRIGALRMPEGYTYDWAGEIEFMEENFADMYTAMLLATVLTYLLLAGILESWKLSVLIMLSLPLSFAGVFVALLVRGLTINVFSLMGIVMLIGLVINNAIVIVDYAALLWRQGLPLKEAVPKACGVRLRPILMANTTTIIAMIPLSLGIGAGGEYRAPMAVTQMGGLLFGGLLALLVTPAIFYLSQKRADRKRAEAAAS